MKLPIMDLLSKIGKDMQEPLRKAASQSLKDEGIQLTSQLLELHDSDFSTLRVPLLFKSRLGRIRSTGYIPTKYLLLSDHQDSDQPNAKEGGEHGCLKELLIKIASDIPRAVVNLAMEKLQDEGVQKTSQLIELARKDFDALCLPLLLKTRLRKVWKRRDVSDPVPAHWLLKESA